jgi:RpiR family transcriptional regulator, carbohydrate utilization regulator
MTGHKNTTRSTGASPSLAACISALSRKRRELIRPVLENPREYVLLSSRALALKLKVDPTTPLRIILRMGFPNYHDFRRYLHELSISQATSIDTMHASKAKGSNLSAHVRETIDHNFQNLQRLRNSLEYDRVAALAKRVHTARRVFLFGGDLASGLVDYLRYHLFFLGMPVFSASNPGDSAHLSQASGKGDLVIAISYRRGLRQTVEAMRRAKTNGAYCVGITDTFVSPIARFADECFITSIESPSFGASYVAPMCLLEGIVAACGYYPSTSAQELLKKQAEEQRTGFRWYKE